MPIKAIAATESTAKKYKRKVQKLVNEADDILNEVDEAHIFQVNSPKHFPSFARDGEHAVLL